MPSTLVIAHALAVVLVIVGVVLDDEVARHLRVMGTGVLIMCEGAMIDHIRLQTLPTWGVLAYFGVLTAVIVAVGWLRPTGLLKLATIVQLSAMYIGLLAYGYQFAHQSIRWKGLPSLLLAFVLLHLGMLTSALKAGLVQRAAQRMLGVREESKGASS
ncbi:MAG: hypothetical protein U0992_19525 [Planctomycetaceae bacterium]